MMLRKLKQSIECFPMGNADISFKMLNGGPMGSNNLGFFPVSSNLARTLETISMTDCVYVRY